MKDPDFWIVFSCFIFGAIISAVSLRPAPPELVLEVDAQVAGGHLFEVYVNNEFDSPRQLPIKAGRLTYRFERIPFRIEALRLDPTDLTNTNFRIYSLRFVAPDGKLLKEVAGRDLPVTVVNAQACGEKDAGTPPESFCYNSTNNDPIAHISSTFDFRKDVLGPPGTTLTGLVSGWLDQLTFQLNKNQKIIYVIAAELIFLFLFVTSFKDLIIRILLLAGYHLGLFAVLWLAQVLPFQPPPVAHALGRSSFFGYAKIKDFFVIYAASLVVSALGLGLSRLTSSLCGSSFQAVSERIENQSQKLRFLPFYMLLSIPIIFLFKFPPMESLKQAILHPFHDLGWDSENVFTWKFLYEMGKIPIIDFFYPYGNQNSYLGPFPSDLLLRALHQTILVLNIVWGSFLILQRKMLPFLMTLIAFLLMGHLEWTVGIDRYFFSFSIVLLFWGFIRSGNRGVFEIIFLASTVLWQFTFEPHQAAYVLVSLSIGTAFQVLTWWRFGSQKENSRFALLTLLMSSILIFAALVVRAGLGELGPFLLFLKVTSLLAVVGAFPAATQEWVRGGYDYQYNEALLTDFILILQFWTAFLVPSAFRNRFATLFGFLLSSLAFIQIIFIKQLIRPHIANQLLAIPFLIIVIFTMFFLAELRRSKFYLALVALCLGLGLSGLGYGFPMRPLKELMDNISSLNTNLKATREIFRHEHQELVNSYFAPETIHFAGFDGAELSSFLKSSGLSDHRVAWAPQKEPRVFIFSDQSALYVALRQPTPYSLTYYDGASLELQNRLVDWVKNNPIDLILFNPGELEFDGVPSLLRNPFIFQHVVLTYKFDRKFHSFDFLQKRPSDEAIDWVYWSKTLGKDLNYGFVGLLSNHDKLTAECRNDCSETFLNIEADELTECPPAKILIGEVAFNIKYNCRPHSTVHIALNRLWFWSLAKATGLEPQIILPEGVRWNVEQRKSIRPFLY
ncbi:MAG: hypothetical protein C5B49_11045 [Bdellovibrio sp.]|nr:MAG: hypothetical protein C5B49_11045 [Bdellovibrio sp.]